MNKMEISRDTLIEDLVAAHPASIKFLSERGIRCLACGEPIWGTIAEAALEKGFSDVEIRSIVDELKVYLAN